MKMKQLLAVLLAMAMVLGLTAAFAEDVDPFAELDNYVMKVGHAQPESNVRHLSLVQFKEEVETATHGHITVEIYANSGLGNDDALPEQIKLGAVEAMRGGHFALMPELITFTAPFIANNREEVSALLDSDLAKEICASAGEKINGIILDVCDAGGFRQFSNNVRPIKTPADMAGLKMRIAPGMDTIDYTFKALGANTVSIPYGDLYMSLNTGVADGQENPWVNIVAMAFYEVQKYFSEVNYQFHPDPFIVNLDWWNELPEEFQVIVQTAATAMGDYNDQLVDELQGEKKQVVMEYEGSEVYVPTAEELAMFVEAVQPVYQQMVEAGICTQEQIDTMFAIVAEVRGE